MRNGLICWLSIVDAFNFNVYFRACMSNNTPLFYNEEILIHVLIPVLGWRISVTEITLEAYLGQVSNHYLWYWCPVGTRRHYDVVLPSHKGRDVVQLKYNFKVTSLLWRLSDCYDTTSVWRYVMVGYGRDLFPTISYPILTSPTQHLNDPF